MKTLATAAFFLATALSAAQVWAADEFVLVKGGTFEMGSPDSEIRREKDEKQHQVTIRDFHMGAHEVTQREYREQMGSASGNFTGDDLPVENVSWYDAVAFCNARSVKEGLTPAYTVTGTGDTPTVVWNRDADGYRLPTEAEWEYACRAGTKTPAT